MIRANIDIIKDVLKQLGNVKPYAFSKEDKDEMINAYATLDKLVKKYTAGNMVLGPLAQRMSDIEVDGFQTDAEKRDPVELK
jgi:hypothetical protein